MDGLLTAYFGSDPTQSEAAAASIAEAISRKEVSVLQLVLGVRPQLTDTKEEHLRRKAVALLVQVVSRAGGALNAQELLTLCGFFIEKLTDWQCAPIAAQGCLDVLQRSRSPPVQLPPDVALQLVRNFLEVQVQGTFITERRLLYQLWQLIIEEYGEAAAAEDLDLVDHMITVVDNERDPRCLLAAFGCMQALGRLYQRPSLAGSPHMTANAGELFDVVVAPYFPMLFTPPKDDPVGLTREQLLQGVVQAMASTPVFAPLAIPYISEKLGSDFKQAKADALVALPACCAAFGAAAVRPLLTPVWLMLKPELMAPGAIEGLPPDELATKRSAAAAAAGALRACCAALGPGELDALVLRDVCVEDLMQYLGISSSGSDGGSGPWWAGPAATQELPGRARGRLACIAAILGAVAASGAASCEAVCQVVLLPLVQSLTTGSIQEHEGLPSQQPASSSSSGWDSWCGRPPEALSAAYAVLCAVFGEVGDAEWAGAAGVAPQHLQQLLHALIPVLTSVQQQMAQMLQEQPIPPAAQAQLCIWHVRLWSRLLQCPPAASLLLQHHEAQAAAAVGWVTPLAVSGDAAEVPLVLSWSEPSSIRQEAVLVLQVLGRAGDAGCQLLSQAAQPLLRQVLQEQQQEELQQQVLGLLGQMAGSSAAAGWQVLQWLQPLMTAALSKGQKELLLGLYQCQNQHCLPVLGDAWSPQQSQAGLAAASSQLAAWSTLCSGSSSSSSSSDGGDGLAGQQQQLVEACIPAAAEGVAKLVAACATSGQMQLALDAFEWVCHAYGISNTLPEDTSAQQQQERRRQCVTAMVQGSLGAAVVLALRPALLQGDSCSQVLAALVGLTCSSGAGTYTRDIAGTAAAALAAKWYSTGAAPAAAGPGTTSSCKDKIREQLQTLMAGVSEVAPADDTSMGCGSGSSSHRSQQLVAVSWLCRALAMQRDDAWRQGLDLAVTWLRAAAETAAPPAAQMAQGQSTAAEAATGAGVNARHAASAPQVVSAAAGFFATLVDDAAGTGALQLGPALHVPCRPLWQQKAFVLAQRQLAEAVSSAQIAMNAATATTGAGAGAGTLGSSRCLPLYLGSAALLAGVPMKVFATAAAEATPMLLDSLQTLAQQLCSASASSNSSSSSGSGACGVSQSSAALNSASGSSGSAAPRPLLLQLVHGCMMKLTQILMEPAMRGLLEPMVGQLVATLVQLALLEEQAAAGGPCGLQASAGSIHSAGGGRNPASAEVREMALLNLTAVMELPYHLLHQHRQMVIKAVTVALDDNKRAVRKAAVRCRRVWSSY